MHELESGVIWFFPFKHRKRSHFLVAHCARGGSVGDNPHCRWHSTGCSHFKPHSGHSGDVAFSRPYRSRRSAGYCFMTAATSFGLTNGVALTAVLRIGHFVVTSMIARGMICCLASGNATCSPGVEVHISIIDCAIDPGPLTSEKKM